MESPVYYTFFKNSNEEPILYCFLEEEEKIRLQSLNYQFYSVTTPQEYNACLQMNRDSLVERSRSEQYIHPSCDNNLSTILNDIVIFNNRMNERLEEGDRKVILNGFVDDIYIYEDRVINTQLYGPIYGKRISDNFKEKLQQMNTDEDIMLIIKIITVNNDSSHIQTAFVNIFDNEIQDIRVLDTAPNPNQNLFISTLVAAFKIAVSENFQSYFYFERNISTIESLQKDERITVSDNELNLKGYCGAWTLFFIYNFIRFNVIDGDYLDENIFDGIYRFLNNKSNMLTAMIIHWWDNVVKIRDAENWDKIPNISYVLPQQSDIPKDF